ncbi:DEAD/DEAH box helicase [Bradyrhizobium sp. CB1717]|uniref:DEAD/DEAH box helicase n=1 Tax=Bradyrhizobium sp. CB1717 TaxID=3039154 RepID=UPI0024B1FE75|nr:DEAD/DEAH box helicase [Bradyrhizobium sp. CB1717]WFU25437.1 DEAD/DEAH box helicase [Bradyrhizobium sp. CB1717]
MRKSRKPTKRSRSPTSKSNPALWAIAEALFANDVARDRAYTLRRYQVETAIRAVEIALAGRNAGIELPTGTGKTLIACLVAALWKKLRPTSRVLLIVPSRTLVVQHFDVALWIAKSLTVDRLTDDQSGDPGALRRTILRSDLLVSTPGILAGAVARGIADDVISSFDLVIVDEFDQFVVVDETDRESAVRYAELWQRLVRELPAAARYLVKSATLGLASQEPKRRVMTKAQRRSALIGKLLNPVAITVPEQSYAAVIPFKPIRMSRVHDGNVAVLLEAVDVSKGKAHLRLDEAIGPVDYRDVERRAPQLCEGAANRSVRLRSGAGAMRSIVITNPVRQAFCGITKLMMMPQHILEDLTRDLGTDFGDCKIKTRRNEIAYLEDVPILRDDRDDDHFHFLRGQKTDALQAIVTVRAKARERGVLFLRTITLLEGLKPILAAARLPLFELTGEKTDHERKVAIDRFRKSANGLLLMTRTTGGRGLDLPFAHYAVFYSPKSDPVTMWQEMSRIRSTVSTPKDIHVLCYGDREVSVLQQVVSALVAENRRVTCSPLDIP